MERNSTCAKVLVLVIVIVIVVLLHINKGKMTNGGKGGTKRVVPLHSGNLNDTIKDNEKVFVKFYAPWCKYCVLMEDEWKKFAETNSTDAVIAEFDASKEREYAASNHGVQSFPTIKLYVNGKPYEYDGKRSAADFMSFLQSKTA